MFSDDPATVYLIPHGDETEDRQWAQDLVDWFQWNHLHIKKGKTNGLVWFFFWHRHNTSEHPGNGH